MALIDSLTANIRSELERRGMSERELARRLGVGQSWLNRRLHPQARDHVALRMTEVEEIADVLHVPVGRFLSVIATGEPAA